MTATSTKVDLSNPDLYTEVFWKIQKCKKRFVVNFGGSGSSKSVSQHQLELINIMESKHHTLFIRKSATDIKDSCFELFKSIAKDWEITHLFHWRYSNSTREIECKHSGRKILFRGIDDPEKVKSIVGIKRIIIEEASQLNFADFRELNRRARGIKDIQIVFILNPVSENHWIKTKIIDNKAYQGRLDVVKSTYKDNQFLTEDDVVELLALEEVDENEFRIYVLGDWGIESKENKFAYKFEKRKHVTEDIDYDPNEYVHLSFDFNVNPITCAVIQDYDNIVSVVECIKLANSDIYKLCDYIAAGYPQGLFVVTGDATGQSRSAMVRDKLNYYTIIKSELGLSSSQFKVPKANPKIEDNRVLVNAAFNVLDIEMSEKKAEGLIYDLLYCEVDENNKLIKDRSSKKAEADALDTWRYWLNTHKKHILKRHKKKNARVGDQAA